MSMEIKKAVRRALPMQLAFFGPEGSGKTMCALLFGKGLAGPNGRICVIDTEKGRASLYADNARIKAAIPEGFDVLELQEPYSPANFVKAIDAVENTGRYSVCIIDSSSDSWNGPGGCEDMAEAAGGMWAKPKMANKKMMTRIKLSGMHIICCLKAQAKTKIVEGAINPKTGKTTKEFLDLGVMPVCEKNFFYPMLLGFSIDPVTHLATLTKYTEDLKPLYAEPHLITKEDGEKLRRWNETGQVADASIQLRERASLAAEMGLAKYQEFFSALPPGQKKVIIDTDHAANKAKAQEADAEQATAYKEEFGPLRSAVGDDAFFRVLGNNGLEKIEDAGAAEREKVLAELARISA